MVDRTALTDALRDPLTGLSTEWHFEIVSTFALGMASRGIPMTIASFAIDGLDTYAERKGLDARDSALQSFGTMLRRTARQTDLAVRMAEDRFLSLLMDCNLQGGLVFADRVRGQAAGFSGDTGLTVSTGLATFIEEMESAVELVEMSTKALSVALASGGDCVKLPQDID